MPSIGESAVGGRRPGPRPASGRRRRSAPRRSGPGARRRGRRSHPRGAGRCDRCAAGPSTPAAGVRRSASAELERTSRMPMTAKSASISTVPSRSRRPGSASLRRSARLAPSGLPGRAAGRYGRGPPTRRCGTGCRRRGVRGRFAAGAGPGRLTSPDRPPEPTRHRGSGLTAGAAARPRRCTGGGPPARPARRADPRHPRAGAARVRPTGRSRVAVHARLRSPADVRAAVSSSASRGSRPRGVYARASEIPPLRVAGCVGSPPRDPGPPIPRRRGPVGAGAARRHVRATAPGPRRARRGSSDRGGTRWFTPRPRTPADRQGCPRPAEAPRSSDRPAAVMNASWSGRPGPACGPRRPGCPASSASAISFSSCCSCRRRAWPAAACSCSSRKVFSLIFVLTTRMPSTPTDHEAPHQHHERCPRQATPAPAGRPGVGAGPVAAPLDAAIRRAPARTLQVGVSACAACACRRGRRRSAPGCLGLPGRHRTRVDSAVVRPPDRGDCCPTASRSSGSRLPLFMSLPLSVVLPSPVMP